MSADVCLHQPIVTADTIWVSADTSMPSLAAVAATAGRRPKLGVEVHGKTAWNIPGVYRDPVSKATAPSRR